MKRRNIVGKLINFRGLVYAPTNEQGVVFLFGKIAHEFGMYVELIRTGYPDCIAKRYIGKGQWEDIRIEFEFKSSDFIRHKHDPQEVDMIVCWNHDWPECPKTIEILELQQEIQKLENISVEAPEKISRSSEYDLNEYLKRGSPESIYLFQILNKRILKIDDNIYNKTHKYRIFYYSPERVFAALKVMRNSLNIHIFTNAKKIRGVEAFEKDYGQKWGRMYVVKRKDVPIAVKAMKRSHQLISYCVKNNIQTGWYAEAEE